MLQKWRDSKQPSKKVREEFTKRAFTHGIDKGSQKTLHEVGLRLNDVLIREGHEVLQGKYNYFLKLENCLKWVREAIPEGDADSLRALLSRIDIWLETPLSCSQIRYQSKYKEHYNAIKAEVVVPVSYTHLTLPTKRIV